MSDLETVEQHLTENADRFVEELSDLLRIPSVSADSQFHPDVRRAANWVADYLTDAGMMTELVETEGHPIVCAEWLKADGAPTVLVYGHYDVQPPDPLDQWTSPAFEPTVRDGKLFARGATDDKGQMFTHILSAAAWLKTTGKLPVNVKFVIEGEEEVGSNNLDRYLEENKEKLAADVAVISDTSQYGNGIPAITYGLRGILAVEVTLKGPNQDLHSGIFGGSVANPANMLCRLLSKLMDDHGRIQIPGFYDDVLELTDDERTKFSELPFDDTEFCANLGVAESVGEDGFSILERRWARPTCDINGLTSGYQGEGPKTIIPSSSSAKITCRLVPNQDPHQLTESLTGFLQENCPPGVEISVETFHGCRAFVFPPDNPFVQAAVRAIHRARGREPVFIREGGSIPVVLSLKEILGIDTLLLGWGRNSDNLHSPDEHFHLEDFHHGIHASAALWAELAAM